MFSFCLTRWLHTLNGYLCSHERRIHCKTETQKSILANAFFIIHFEASPRRLLLFRYLSPTSVSCSSDTHQNICFSCPIVYPSQSHIEACEFRILIEEAYRDEASTVYSHAEHNFFISQMPLHLKDSVRVHLLRSCPIVMERWRA